MATSWTPLTSMVVQTFLVTFLVCGTLAQFNVLPKDDIEETGSVEGVECIGNGKFYRNPEFKNGIRDCARYHWCPRGKVLEFRCSAGLWFDVDRQICDFKHNIKNCEKSHDNSTPRPLFATDSPICPEGQLACADRKCLNRDLFCDGQVDCNDGSDESYCDPEHDPNAPGRCDLTNCTLPDCFCSFDATLIPGNLPREETPQMVIITFDDAINNENWDIYEKLFLANRTNGNDCPIRGTFFLSHEYTNYRHVQKMWNDGHEIATHSITHRNPELWWTYNTTIEDWFDEFAGMANIVNRFAGIPLDELRGTRVPFLRVGWNSQFIMMKEFGFLYDSSMVAPKRDPPLWPYTLDFKIPHKCSGSRQKCPSRSFPGIWEMIMNPFDIEGHTCAMVDSCPTHLSDEEVFDMFMENFDRHYRTNKAPFGIYFHTTWFKQKQNFRVFLKFIDELLKKPDVYFVTNYQAIEWMRTPTPLSQLNNFEPWKCAKEIDPNLIACNHPKLCKLSNRALRNERYLQTCFECPEVYPWIKNEFGVENNRK